MSVSGTADDNDHLSEEERECIERCHEATDISEWCADECLGSEEMERCARLCRDVADVASLHARFMARESEHSGDLAELCAEVCEACAEECSNHDADHCNRCAEILTECADSCRSLA